MRKPLQCGQNSGLRSDRLAHCAIDMQQHLLGAGDFRIAPPQTVKDMRAFLVKGEQLRFHM
ncbi:hypothetical protein D3C80_1757220 [compost metagenome]